MIIVQPMHANVSGGFGNRTTLQTPWCQPQHVPVQRIQLQVTPFAEGERNQQIKVGNGRGHVRATVKKTEAKGRIAAVHT